MFNFLSKSYEKVCSALGKTRSLLGSKLSHLLKGKIDVHTLEKLEELFYEADLGVKSASELTEKIQRLLKNNPTLSSDELLSTIKVDLKTLLDSTKVALNIAPEGPTIILIVGVNGNGKTTSVAKLTNLLQQEGKRVLIAAADTFRAAATEQLELWAQRLKSEVVKGNAKADPSAVVYDALSAAIARNVDVVLIDTAGRLHTKQDLMQELQKIKRVCTKLLPGSPHETLLVLEAVSGQNAIDQAKKFNEFTPISGLILTKLDGTAKGGIVVAIQQELKIPVKFIGLGEGIEDFETFNAETFVNALFE